MAASGRAGDALEGEGMTRADDTPFAQRLRCVMGINRITMQRLGFLCGVTPQAVLKWTQGKAMPSSSACIKICKAGGCSMEWLFFPKFLDLESTDEAPQGRHAKYWAREVIAELRECGDLPARQSS